MNLLVDFGMTIYSVIHAPIAITTLIVTLFFDKTDIVTWSDFLYQTTITMMASCGMAILFIGIPYVSKASIDQFLVSAGVWQLIWYHAVVLGTFGFNTGGLISLYLYVDAAFKEVPSNKVVV